MLENHPKWVIQIGWCTNKGGQWKEDQLWFSLNLFSEIIEEKKELDSHQKTLPFPPIPEEMPEYDTISTFNVSSFPFFLGPDSPLSPSFV